MNLVDMKELYTSNPKIKEYVDKYMKCHRMLNVEDAFKCSAVKEYYKYITGEK